MKPCYWWQGFICYSSFGYLKNPFQKGANMNDYPSE